MDSYSGNDFGAEEARTGYKADGGYTVLLPDGRKQVLLTYVLSTVPIGYSNLGYSSRAAYSDLIPNGTRSSVIAVTEASRYIQGARTVLSL